MYIRKIVIVVVIVVLASVLLLVYLTRKPKSEPASEIVHEIERGSPAIDSMKQDSQFHSDMRKALHEKNLDKARVLLDSAIEINPNNKMLITYKGMIFAGQGHHLAAIEQYDKAIVPGSETPYPLGNRATSYLELKMFDKAITDLRIASAMNGEYYFMLAYAFEQSGQADSAKFYYAK